MGQSEVPDYVSPFIQALSVWQQIQAAERASQRVDSRERERLSSEERRHKESLGVERDKVSSNDRWYQGQLKEMTAARQALSEEKAKEHTQKVAEWEVKKETEKAQADALKANARNMNFQTDLGEKLAKIREAATKAKAEYDEALIRKDLRAMQRAELQEQKLAADRARTEASAMLTDLTTRGKNLPLAGVNRAVLELTRQADKINLSAQDLLLQGVEISRKQGDVGGMLSPQTARQAAHDTWAKIKAGEKVLPSVDMTSALLRVSPPAQNMPDAYRNAALSGNSTVTQAYFDRLEQSISKSGAKNADEIRRFQKANGIEGVPSDYVGVMMGYTSPLANLKVNDAEIVKKTTEFRDAYAAEMHRLLNTDPIKFDDPRYELVASDIKALKSTDPATVAGQIKFTAKHIYNLLSDDPQYSTKYQKPSDVAGAFTSARITGAAIDKMKVSPELRDSIAAPMKKHLSDDVRQVVTGLNFQDDFATLRDAVVNGKRYPTNSPEDRTFSKWVAIVGKDPLKKTVGAVHNQLSRGDIVDWFDVAKPLQSAAMQPGRPANPDGAVTVQPTGKEFVVEPADTLGDFELTPATTLSEYKPAGISDAAFEQIGADASVLNAVYPSVMATQGRANTPEQLESAEQRNNQAKSGAATTTQPVSMGGFGSPYRPDVLESMGINPNYVAALYNTPPSADIYDSTMAEPIVAPKSDYTMPQLPTELPTA